MGRLCADRDAFLILEYRREVQYGDVYKIQVAPDLRESPVTWLLLLGRVLVGRTYTHPDVPSAVATTRGSQTALMVPNDPRIILKVRRVILASRPPVSLE